MNRTAPTNYSSQLTTNLGLGLVIGEILGIAFGLFIHDPLRGLGGGVGIGTSLGLLLNLRSRRSGGK